MSEMFEGLSIALLALSNFDTANVEDMSYMFSEMSELISLKLSSKFITDKVQSMYKMFYNCKSLHELDISNFKTDNCQSLGEMFTYCENIQYLDVTNFNTINVKEMNSMFKGCLKLTSINGLEYFDTNNVIDTSEMFRDCRELININLGENSLWKKYYILKIYFLDVIN